MISLKVFFGIIFSFAARWLPVLPRGPAKWVRLGELNLEDSDEDAEPQDFTISEIILHPDYKLPARYHDIALLKLSKKVVFSAYIRPACLQVEKDFKDTTGIAIGYGRMDYGIVSFYWRLLRGVIL
jgi:hypothetical protein